MGQYYRPVLEIAGVVTIYGRYLDKRWIISKLMEHSYIGNYMMNTVSKDLFERKGRLLWCGDYAEDNEIEITGLTVKSIWQVNGDFMKKTKFRVNNLYLCNHDTKEYINMKKYITLIEADYDDHLIVHPLSLLTAVGNGRGGGDYYGINKDYVGLWVWNLISFEKEKPLDYKEFDIEFKEE